MKGVGGERAVERRNDGHWEWFFATEAPPDDITGKYLFFSSDRDLLVGIAVEELRNGEFDYAKIPMVGKNLSDDYVLCLYHRDDSRKRDLASKYGKRDGLRYRYWKSDEATLRGEYSEQFLRTVGLKDRR